MSKLFTPVVTTILILLSFSVSAVQRYHYSAEVEGMVCAFCAYNVSKKLGSIEAIDADSVDVDLVDGSVRFDATAAVDEARLKTLFADSGFSLSRLTQTASPLQHTSTADTAALVIQFDAPMRDRFTPILESLGELAADSALQLRIHASAEEEQKLLKPILMGRQQVIKTRFLAQPGERIRIEVFAP